MKIYNTLTRKKEEFTTLEKGKASIYACGPTVYDVPHIGHVRSAYVFHIIRKYFQYEGYEVTFVKNITDIDDKIIKKACEEIENEKGRLVQADIKGKTREIAERYLKLYHEDLASFSITAPDHEPKATENIDKMIEFISKLIEKGFAYVSGGDVYFSVAKFASYGSLSGQDKEQMLDNSRIDINEKKKDPLDFVLWKRAKEFDPSWPSPWGEGRPGWHIECSAMSTSILGDEFDIHGGGLDLIFPHHENEIAQSRSMSGKDFARYWVHNGLLTVDKDKMSKSVKNFVTVPDFIDKYKDVDLLKILFFSSHYRSHVDYSREKIEEAKNIKKRIVVFINRVKSVTGQHLPGREIIPEKIKKIRSDFNMSMDDDFNTPSAMAVLFEAMHKGNEILKKESLTAEDISILKYIEDFIIAFSDIFSLSLALNDIDEMERMKIEAFIIKREKARKDKNFSLADSIRKELLAMGVQIEDGSKGTIWRKY